MKQSLTFEMAFCTEACDTSWIKQTRQHILQSEELKYCISGLRELASAATFFDASAGKQCRTGVTYITSLGTELSPPLWMFPSLDLKAVPKQVEKSSHGCYRRQQVFSHLSPSLTLPFWPFSYKIEFSPTKFKSDNCTPDLEFVQCLSYLFVQCVHWLPFMSNLWNRVQAVLPYSSSVCSYWRVIQWVTHWDKSLKADGISASRACPWNMRVQKNERFPQC